MKSNLSLKYIYHTLLFLLITFSLDFFVGKFCQIQYFSRTHGLLHTTTYSIDSTKSDILILGSSRANHHYIPKIFEDSLHLSCYNTGRDACFIIYQLAVLKSVVKRYTPKIVIYDLIPYDFLNINDNYDKLDFLLPYYKTHIEIKNLLDNYRKYEPIKTISNIYPYNSSIFYFGRNSKKDLIIENQREGYIESQREWNYPRTDEKETADPFEYNQQKIQALKEMILTCKQHNIQLFFVVSPYYQNINQRLKKIIQITNDLAKTEKIPFWDLSQDTVLINHGKLFFDVSHLNSNGAKIFSNIIANKIANSERQICTKSKI